MTCLCERTKTIDGIERYEGNRIVRFLLDASSSVDLNLIWKMYLGNYAFSKEEMKQFYKLIGYTIDGFWEIFEEEN